MNQMGGGQHHDEIVHVKVYTVANPRVIADPREIAVILALAVVADGGDAVSRAVRGRPDYIWLADEI